METLEIKEIFENNKKDQQVTLVGWVKTNRDSGKIGFISVNDGSSMAALQVVYKKDFTKGFEIAQTIRTGSAISVSGKCVLSIKPDQPLEVLADEIILLKQSSEDYPLQKKQHSMEFLRDIAHLRARTTTVYAIMRLRSKLSFAIHNFFNKNNFTWVAAPIITSNDAEGAGENFEIFNPNQKDLFFNKKASLSVSGQLNAEAYAQAFKKVYTFGPTFRAEKSHTNRHLSEFWMVEPEVAFIDLQQLMVLIENMFKSVVNEVLVECKTELDFFSAQNSDIKSRLEKLTSANFKKMEYSEAITILTKAIKDGTKFEDNEIFFGKDLASEHERYLCENVINGPLFLFNFPKEIKAFYMKTNSDNKTVAACDLLVPGVGEIIGGSQREDDYQLLIERCKTLKIDYSSLEWYLNLRKYGYYSSAGFGLGLERLLMYLSGVENIKDTIPFPRFPGALDF